MQICRWAAHENLHRRDATQALGQSRISLGDHPGIRDGDDVAAQLAAAGANEVIKVRASDFFFAFDQENEIHRQGPFLAQQVGGAENVGENLSLVVRRPAGEDALVAYGRLEGRRGPEIQRLLGLDVIVSVNEHSRPARRFGAAGQHSGVSAGFRDLRLEPAMAEQGAEPIRAGPHFRRVVRLGRHAAEAQQFKEEVHIGLTDKRETVRR